MTWVRHTISYGGNASGGLQIAAVDIERDNDVDVVSGGKSALFLAVNHTK